MNMGRVTGAVPLLLLVAACGDVAAPVNSGSPVVTIRGVVTGAPDDSVFLMGVAIDPLEGTLPDSTLRWWVNGDSAAVGPVVGVRLPVSGTVRVELRVRGPRGEGVAEHEIAVAEPGRLLWSRLVPALGWWDLAAAGGDLLLRSGGSVLRIARGPAVVGMYTGWFLGAVPGSRDAYLRTGDTVSRVSPDGNARWLLDSTTGRAAVMLDGGLAIERAGLERRAPDGTLIWKRAWPGGGAPSQVIADRDGRLLLLDTRGTGYLVSATGDSLATIASIDYPGCGILRGLLPGPSGGVVSFVAPPPRSAGGCIAWRDATTGAVTQTYVAGDTLRLESLASGRLAIAGDGTIYLGLDNGAVVAIDATGVQRWWAGPRETVCRFRRADEPPKTERAPALGADGTVFHHAAGRLMAVAPDGTIIWTAITSEEEVADGCYLGLSAPLLTTDGRVVVIANDRLLVFAAGTTADTTALWGQAGGGPSRGRGPR